tara:strand:+ start:277 stop:1017 length:741 start_codon:yes stop_codon:yes gene_type:complete
VCNDGGPDSESKICPVGTNCNDCGVRDCTNKIINTRVSSSHEIGCQDHQCMDIESSEECGITAAELGYEYYGSIDDFMTNHTAFHCLGFNDKCIEGNNLDGTRTASSTPLINWNDFNDTFEGFTEYCTTFGNLFSKTTTAYRGRCPASYSNNSKCLNTCKSDPLQHKGKTKSEMLRGCFLCNENCHPVLHNKFVWSDRDFTTGSLDYQCNVPYANCVCTCPVTPQSGSLYGFGMPIGISFTPIRGT